MERRRALESAERLRRGVALDAIGEGIVITDSRARIQYVNPAFERITGYEQKDVVGENPRVLQSGQHDHAFYMDMWNTIAAGRVWRGSLVDRRKDGTLYHVDSTIAPIQSPEGDNLGYVAVSRDVNRAPANRGRSPRVRGPGPGDPRDRGRRNRHDRPEWPDRKLQPLGRRDLRLPDPGS